MHLNNCFGVRVAVSAWSAGVGQHLKGLQMLLIQELKTLNLNLKGLQIEKTPRRQKAYSVNRMKMARGTREYITWKEEV